MHYKLRATAVRPGFAITHRDLTALCPITILRGFGPEAGAAADGPRPVPVPVIPDLC